MLDWYYQDEILSPGWWMWAFKKGQLYDELWACRIFKNVLPGIKFNFMYEISINPLQDFWQHLTFIGPCIANIFVEYNQQDATFHNLFISVRHSTCFRLFVRPSSEAQNCTYSVRYLSDQYLTLYVQIWALDDGRTTRLKHVERLTEINKLWNVASCWLYFTNCDNS